MIQSNNIQIIPKILSLVAGIDEFKGTGRALGNLLPDRLSEQVRRLNCKVEREKIVLAALPELSPQPVECAWEHGRITMGDAIRRTGGNCNMLKQSFRALVKRGHLAQHGAGRGIWYE